MNIFKCVKFKKVSNYVRPDVQKEGDDMNIYGMTLLCFKTILHKKCRSGKNSEGPAENSWVLDPCPAKWKQISKSL
jgi:hypothetical protein